MAALDLTTLSLLKSWLKLTPDMTSEDVLLAQLITWTSDWLADICERDFIAQDYTEIFDGTGSDRLMMPNTPINSISSVMVNNNLVMPSLSTNQIGFTYDKNSVTLYGMNFARGKSNVRIVYNAGYTVIPPDLQFAATQVAALRYRERDHIGKVSDTTSAGQQTMYQQKFLTPDILAIVQKYRRNIPV